MAKRKKSTFERLQSERWSRKERRQLERLLNSAEPGLSVVHADAAGIDVGNESHFVAVPPDRAPQPVREFGSWMEALRNMAEWLQSCGIRTVAMQSTGVYWVALLEVLEAAGLEVYLVNARGTKNLPGRKSDVQECQWLLKLHTYGLLRNSFRPPEQIPGGAHGLAAAGAMGAGSGEGCAADAESADEDECATGEYHQRSEWGDRNGHFAGDCVGSAGSLGTGKTA